MTEVNYREVGEAPLVYLGAGSVSVTKGRIRLSDPRGEMQEHIFVAIGTHAADGLKPGDVIPKGSEVRHHIRMICASEPQADAILRAITGQYDKVIPSLDSLKKDLTDD